MKKKILVGAVSILVILAVILSAGCVQSVDNSNITEIVENTVNDIKNTTVYVQNTVTENTNVSNNNGTENVQNTVTDINSTTNNVQNTVTENTNVSNNNGTENVQNTVTDTKKTYVVGIDVYEPYSWTDEKGNIVGFDVDCMKWIAEEEGYNVTFDYIDWDALATYLQTGKRDIICSGLSITPEREKVIAFTNPYHTISIDVVSLAGKNYTMDQFYNGDLKIGVQAGCSAYEGLKGYLGDELYEKMKAEGKIVDTYSTFALSMQDLKNGRVDVVIFDNAGIDSQIKNNKGIFEKVGTVEDTEEKFAAAVKKGNTELLQKLNDGYAKLMASPYWQELLEKYGLNVQTETDTQTDADTKKTYVVGIDVFAPYSWTDEKGNIVGFDVDCMKWIAEEEGYDVTFDYIDWDSLTTYLQTGKCDIICSGLSITPEREKVIAFTNPYQTTSIDVVSLAGKNYTMDQFYNGDLKIGVQNGCSAYEGLKGYLGDELYEKMKAEGKIVDTYSTFALSMQDLKNGRVDVVIFDNAGIDSQIKNNPGIFEKVGTISDTEEKFAVAVKKGNTELLQKLNDGYAKLKASSYWQELLTKYGIQA